MKWSRDNLQALPASERLKFALAMQRELAKYGDEPGEIERAAAHEAGHCVVGKALGETIVGARLIRLKTEQGIYWAGANRRMRSDAEPDACFNISEHPIEGVRYAVHNMSGYIGECLASMEHPSSSLDERMAAKSACNTVGREIGLETGDLLDAIYYFATFLIASNRLAFDTVRGHLLRNRRMTGTEAARMHKGVEPTNLDQFFSKLEEWGRKCSDQ